MVVEPGEVPCPPDEITRMQIHIVRRPAEDAVQLVYRTRIRAHEDEGGVSGALTVRHRLPRIEILVVLVAHNVISAAPSSIRLSRGTTSSLLSCAHQAMSSSSPAFRR